MRVRPPLAGALLLAGLLASALALGAGTRPVRIADDAHDPQPWQALAPAAQAQFDLGHAVFNTTWMPAGSGGRRSGLGPVFDAASCDACHNSRRRGRGPQGDGPVPPDLVLQVATRQPDGTITPGHVRFGRLLNTSAIAGFAVEAQVDVRYQPRAYRRADGSTLLLHVPAYTVRLAGDAPPPQDLVLMPRLAPAVLGSGLLERVPEAAVLALPARQPAAVRGTPAWVDTAQGRRLGRFGWQATQPDIAGQTAAAFAREMGLTNTLLASDDCAPGDAACRAAPQGSTPEVAPDLFAAVVAFQQGEAMRRTPQAIARAAQLPDAPALFARVGCTDCHRPRLPLAGGGAIPAYTDLLLHDLGPDLADRDGAGRPLPSRWRTAPLWGMSTALEGQRPLRLLHDGRARSLEEAIAWHGGQAAAARARFDALPAAQRERLLDWLQTL
ncbi:di-heme oxidoredictase family protein [Thermomonas flagellata]|uniref:di-heme oxidoredictase family protein n=1 Tax=Thermomonas flagellata TaxID=2888524 RepID=UPI001F04A9C6|nr:di-heme oxidoredictase family protein [Thermomonas flagellata]